jgi:hypothetical protein
MMCDIYLYELWDQYELFLIVLQLNAFLVIKFVRAVVISGHPGFLHQ